MNMNQISTHTSLAGRDQSIQRLFKISGQISTHTSLAGRDIYNNDDPNHLPNFYSHVPRGT